MPKTFLFQANQFSQTTKFSISMPLVLFNPYIEPLSGATTPGSEWTWEQWQSRGAPHSPKPKHHWNFTIRLFSVIYRTLIGRSYPSAEQQLVYSTAPADWAICTNDFEGKDINFNSCWLISQSLSLSLSLSLYWIIFLTIWAHPYRSEFLQSA